MKGPVFGGEMPISPHSAAFRFAMPFAIACRTAACTAAESPAAIATTCRTKAARQQGRHSFQTRLPHKRHSSMQCRHLELQKESSHGDAGLFGTSLDQNGSYLD